MPFDPLGFFRSLPIAPNIDASAIKGNIPVADTQLALNIGAHFVHNDKVFCSEIGKRAIVIETNVWERGKRGLESETIYEIRVEEGRF